MAGMMERMLPDVSEEGSHEHITLNTWFDRLIKALTVWLPLLVSGTLFLGELTGGEFQNVICYPSSNLTFAQANYLNAFCKDSMPLDQIWYSLFPYTIPLIALIMNLPHFLWKVSAGAKLKSRITFISKQIENSFALILKLHDLEASDIEVIIEGDRLADQRHKKKKNLIAIQIEKSVSMLLDYTETLKGAKKLLCQKIAKLVSLMILPLAISGYLFWFFSGLFKDHTFVCNAIVFSSNNGTEAEEYIKSTCKIIDVKHLYYVSFILGVSCCFAVIPLAIFFLIKTKCCPDMFLYKLLQNLGHLGKTKTVVQEKFGTFSDFSIIGRLCGENRHLIPSFYMIMYMGNKAGGDNKAAGSQSSSGGQTASTPSHRDDMTRPEEVEGQAGQSLPTSKGEPNRPRDTGEGNDGDDPGALNIQFSSRGTSSNDSYGAGPEAASTRVDEAVMHPQSSPGDSPSNFQTDTEDEAMEKGLTGEETKRLLPVLELKK